MPWQCRMRAAEILGMARMSVMEVSNSVRASTTTNTDSFSCLVMAVSHFLTLDNIDTRWLLVDRCDGTMFLDLSWFDHISWNGIFASAPSE